MSTTSASNIALTSDSAPAVVPPKQSRLLATLAVGVGAATLAVGLTLMFTKGPAAPAQKAAEATPSSVAASGARAPGTTGATTAAPIPDPPPHTRPHAGGTAAADTADAPIELGPTPSRTTSGKRHVTHPKAQPPTPPPPPAPAPKPKASGGVATSPGF
jgi:hypothetical protein